MSDGHSKKDEPKRSLLPSENLKTRSIAKNLTVSLVLSIALVSVVFISLNYLNASRREKAWIENKADEYTTILTGTIEIPLWDLDRESIENIGISYMNNYLIVKLKIFDASGKVFFEKEKENDEDLVERAGKVFHDGELLGYVEISLTTRHYKESNRRLLWSSIFAILIVLLCLITLTGFLLRMYLRKPIKQLSEIVNSYASGVYNSSKHWMPFVEFQQFISVLGEMGEKITAQMSELREAEEKYRSIFENAVEGVFQTTADGRILSANPAMARILGHDSSEELIESVNDKANELYVNPERQKEFIRIARERKAIFGFDAQFYCKNGSKIWVTINARSSYDENGELLFFEGFIEDTTERKRMEDALRKAHDELEIRVAERTEELSKAKIAAEIATRAKSEFLASMSHELRTPLSAIIGFSEILEDQTFGELNEKQTKYINNVLVSGRRLLQLINDILDLNKVDAGEVELELSKFDVAQAVRDIQSVAKGLANKKDISLTMEADWSLPPIIADQQRFKQIMHNLLSNAIKFTPDNGEIRLSAELISNFGSRISELEKEGRIVSDQSTIDNRQSAIQVSVADSGIGIKPEDHERVFGEFEQLDSSYDRKHDGTGLGLALTRRLVELHGGRIWVESEGEAKGSTFIFVIPIEAEKGTFRS